MQPESTSVTAGNADGKARLLTLGDLDGRTVAARRARTLLDSIQEDLGGADRLSAAQQELAARAAALGALLADGETRLLAGQNIDITQHLAAVNVQRRVLATLGLSRVARDVTPDPLDYARRKAA